MPPPPLRPLARVCRPYLLGRSAICPHPNLDKDEAPATTILLRSATPLTLRARPSLPSSATPPIRNTYNKKEREGGRSFTFALVPLPHSIPSQSVAKIINHGDRACLLFGKMGSEGRSARRSSGEEKKCPSYGKVVGCGRLAAVSKDRVSFCE